MQKNTVRWFTLIGFMVLLTIGAFAQTPSRLRGSIDASGPWKVRGEWSLHIKGESGKADFSAAFNMQRSDYFLLSANPPAADTPANLSPHTHHITIKDADVTAVANGIQVSGIATITSNGNIAPISSSPVTIVITGGSAVEYSNINITFGGKAANHFGTDPLNGVVRSVGGHHE